MRYLPLSDADRSEMLRVIGASSIDELFRDVPEEARLKGPIEGLPLHASELAVERHMTALARKNMVAGDVPFFLGCGAYRHHIPASVDHIIQRGEFLTSYTPYQPEIAQGTLQMLFEFQTQVARLFGCEVANASMYDGSTAMWEAIVMAHRITRRNKTIISSGVHPHYVSVAKTMAKFTGDELADRAAGTDRGDGHRAADRRDRRRDQRGRRPISRHPRPDRRPDADRRSGACGGRAADRGGDRAGGARADQVAGRDGRGHRRRRRPVASASGCSSAGPMSACSPRREKYVRQMPGRLAGETVDAEGKRGFVLTLSTREQHIRREKATSNICTNSGAVRAGLLGAHDAARREGAAAARLLQSRARVRSGGAAGGDPGRRAGQRQLLQRIHPEAAGRGAAGGPCDGREGRARRRLARPALSGRRGAGERPGRRGHRNRDRRGYRLPWKPR